MPTCLRKMVPFPLLSVYPDLLGKILSKFEEKSYYRLQKTGKDANEFVHKCRTVVVHSREQVVVEYDEAWSTWGFVVSRYKATVVDVQSLYGIRLNVLELRETSTRFGRLCRLLNKNRITCTTLVITEIPTNIWTSEQCATLFKILKPAEVELNSQGSNRSETLFEVKPLERVLIFLDSSTAAIEAAKLLPTVPELSINLRLPMSDQLPVFRTVLQILLSKPFPNLCKFTFYAFHPGQQLPSKDEFVKHFGDFKFTVKKDNERERILSMDPPSHFTPETTCEVSFRETHASILYEVDREDEEIDIFIQQQLAWE